MSIATTELSTSQERFSYSNTCLRTLSPKKLSFKILPFLALCLMEPSAVLVSASESQPPCHQEMVLSLNHMASIIHLL